MIMRADRKVADKSKKSGGFVYRPRSEKSIKERAEQRGGAFDGPFKSNYETFRPKDGDNTIRILPATWDPQDHYGFDLWVHSWVGINSGTYPCLQQMKKKRCPICEAQAEAKDAGEDDDARKLKATRKVVVWIIDREEDKPIPKLYSMSWTMDRDISALCQNKKGGKSLLIDSPDVGYDVEFKKKGKGLNTEYYAHRIDRDPSKIFERSKDQDAVLEYINENKIPDCIKYYTAEYLSSILDGSAEEKDEELDTDTDDEEEKPKKKAKGESWDDDDEDGDEDESPKKKKKVVAKDEDEDDDDEEEDEAPKKKKVARTPTKKSRDEDEDDEDESDEDEEEGEDGEEESSDEEDGEDDGDGEDSGDEDEEESDEDDGEEAEPDDGGDDDDVDDDDEEDEPPPKKKKKVRR